MLKSELENRVTDLENQLGVLEDVSAVEQDCAHIAVEWREIGGIRIGLDACGNAVRVEFPRDVYGWSAE